MTADQPDGTANAVRFVLDGRVVTATQPPTTTVLEYLRETAHRTGTKEGCAEGDCGACTVVLGELAADGGRIGYRAVNSCIRFLPTIDGRELVTVESLRAPDGRLHPVQQSLVDHHASQCGFCTPGFVMSLFALYLQEGAADREQVLEALSGNLCRCTGYRPIIEAGLHMGEYAPPSHWNRGAATCAARRRALDALKRAAPLRLPGFFAPRTIEELAAALESEPDALVLAGGTDVGLWVTKHLRQLPPIVYLGEVAALKRVQRDADRIVIGAAVSLTDAWIALGAEFPELAEQAQRFASPPVRNSGTLCGNLANGSPIGDSLPILMALGAELELRRGLSTRRVPLERFYKGYQRKDLLPGEFIESVRVPVRSTRAWVGSYKLSKRIEQDISAISAAFVVEVAQGTVAAARIAYGGMAGVAARAPAVERALVGGAWDRASVEAAAACLAEDFRPLSDLRARRIDSRPPATCCAASTSSTAAGLNPHARPMRPRHATGTDALSSDPTHDSAHLHVSGRALYTDDIALPAHALHAAFGVSGIAHGRIVNLDLDPVRAMPGVAAVVVARDVPGENNYGSAQHDDPIFAQELVQYAGQPVFAVAASSYALARRAARAGRIHCEALPALLDIRAALAAQSYVLPSVHLARGRPREMLSQAAHRLRGSLSMGGQDHFYLEGQIAVALPQEDGGMLVHSSTQHPSEVQQIVAQALGKRSNEVTVQCRRMGGGFGGKETQPALIAAAAAVLAHRTGRPVKLRLDRDLDMLMTGKRHDFLADYEVGFDDAGRISALSIMLASRCGYSADLSGPVNDRALMHLDNAYYLEHLEVVSHRCKTHTVSNTAFRGFGGPQGMMVIEHIVDEIARALRRDALDVRRANFYGAASRNVTHYGQTVEDNLIHEIVDELALTSRYRERRRGIAEWNAASAIVKRGIALTPVKFGISFTATMFNQAGALVHVYSDGTVLLNHGGTEMGQGLFTKVAQVVAAELGLPLSAIRVTATDTSKVPNTSASAASASTDLNGKAAQAAAQAIRARLVAFACETYGAAPEDVRLRGGVVAIGARELPFAELVQRAYQARISLSATGFYKTPKIDWDKQTFRGRPFYYFAYGAAVSEVALDTLTGETQLLRVDILHDVGASLNAAIDLGQIEGGFLQGVGWLTSEELWWNSDGELKTHAPSTYKIPTARDWPLQATVRLFEGRPNREDTIHRSKAVGEPPLMLAISVFHAIRDAVASGASNAALELTAPATPEAVLRALGALPPRPLA